MKKNYLFGKVIDILTREDKGKLCGPVDDKVYGPYPKSKGSAVVKKGLPCQPCYRKFRMSDCQDRRCLTDLSVEAVLREAQKLL